MPATLIVPLALATIFTAGGVLIQKLERHAERITGILGVVLLLFSFLDILAVFSRLAYIRPPPIPQAAVDRASNSKSAPRASAADGIRFD